MDNIRKLRNFVWFCLFTFAFCLIIAGCSTGPITTLPKITDIPGTYHKVQKQETLWRISKIYNVDLDELIRINRISNASNLEVGQLIFIPRQERTKQPNIQIYNSSEDFIMPTKGKVIAGFGQIFNGVANKGINIQPYGVSDVVASRGGRVAFCADQVGGFGKTVIIDHGDGIMTVYAENKEILVRPGDKVQKGLIIARAGGQGGYVHFEIRKGHTAQNPYFYLDR